jgi:hypothetical protein
MGRLKSIPHTTRNWWHLKCKFLYKHDYILEKKYNEDILKLHCKKCQKKFGVNLSSSLIFAWDEDMMFLLSINENYKKNDASSQQSINIETPLKAVI